MSKNKSVYINESVADGDQNIARTGLGIDASLESSDILPSKKKSAATTSVNQPPNKFQINASFYGKLVEHYFITEAIERGFMVWPAFAPDSPADVVIHNGRRYLGIQIKGCHSLNKSKQSYFVPLATSSGVYKSEEIDFFAIYISPTSTWYLLPYSEAGKTFEVQKSSGSQSRHLNNWSAMKAS